MTPMEKPKSQAARAVNAIRDLIFSGELAAGSNHLESALAERLGMSRTPVREAVMLLQTQGLLEVRPRKGVHILPVSLNDMVEVYEILTELESLAVERAARKKLDIDDLTALADILIELDRALLSDDKDAWAKADDAFHLELVRLGGNSRIELIAKTFNSQVWRARRLTLEHQSLPQQSNRDHRAVYNAIVAGDGARARQIHWSHRVEATRLFRSLLEEGQDDAPSHQT